MSHRELDSARTELLRPRGGPAVEVDAGLRTAPDLDFLPGEMDAGAERLANRLLRREAPRVVLRGIAPRVAVLALGGGEAPLGEGAAVPLERAPDAVDLDQVDAHTE